MHPGVGSCSADCALREPDGAADAVVGRRLPLITSRSIPARTRYSSTPYVAILKTFPTLTAGSSPWRIKAMTVGLLTFRNPATLATVRNVSHSTVSILFTSRCICYFDRGVGYINNVYVLGSMPSDLEKKADFLK